MSRLVWDKDGERFYETGTKQGVLYLRDDAGKYTKGVAWNGLTGVTESPSGAEVTSLYADDIKYLNLTSAEEFGGTITAYTYPEEFAECNGEISIAPGVVVAQQARKTFGLCYRTVIGNDVQGEAYAYKLHIVYGCTASPSEKAYATINDSPEAIEFSWEFSTTPVSYTIAGMENLKPTALITIDSSKFTDEGTKAKLKELEDKLYGTEEAEPTLPTPEEIYTILKGVG